MKRRTFLLFVLFLASLSLPGAEPAMPVQTQRLTTGRGLSNNFVVSLDIDRYGAVWIGTEEGMNRFDGVSVHDYTQASGSIPGNNLNQVLADRNSDVVWVGTQRAGLGRYHYLTGQSDLFYPDGSETGISSPEITHMEQDGNGNIWISTYLDGIDRFNPSTGAIDHFNSTNVEGMLDYRIHCFTIGADGKIYIGHYGEGVTVLDPEKRTAVRYEANGQENGLPSNIIGCVYRDPDNNIWFGTWSGLAFFRPVTRDFHVFNRENSDLPEGEIFSVMVTQDRKLLVSPDFQGVWTADLDAISGHPAFTRLPQTEELSDIGVHAMCEDAFGNLWLGSYGRGVLFVSRRPKPFSAYLYPDPLSSSSVTSVAFSRDGRLIVGGEGGRIDILDRDFHRMDDPRSGDTGKSILSSLVDTDGNLWVGSFTGTTAVYDAAGRRKFQVPVVEVRCMLQQGDSLWLGTGTGLYLADRKSGNLLHRFSAQDRLPENFLRSLALDPQGRLWVGTFGRGVIVYDRNMETVAHFQTGSVSSANMVLDLLADREGRMWAATGRGLVRYDLSGPVPVVDSTFSVRTPLRSEFIRALVEDRDGDIWFATNLSICRVDRNDGEVTEFGYRNNIAPGNYQNGAAAIRDDGYLCFGSTEGITVFYPGNVKRGDVPPRVHFSELGIFTSVSQEQDRQTVFLGNRKEIVLNHRQNNFFISFAPDDFGLMDQTEFSWRIGSGDWYPAENSHVLNFRQLPPGKYLLQVRSRLINDDWSRDVAFLQIRITPPWWLSKVALILYALLALLLAGIVVTALFARARRRNNLKQEQAAARMEQEANEERLRFYTNITHELRTPLTLIISPAEDLKNDPSLSEKARAKVRVVQQNANRLLDLINTLLNFRKTETENMQVHAAYGDLSTMVEGVGRGFVEANTHRETAIALEVEKGILTEFDPDIVTSILNNLMSNALKYTPSGTVTLRLATAEDGRTAEMSVSDTGYGIARDELEKIFQRYYQIRGDHLAQGTGIGLALVKNLVQLSGWQIHVDSEPGKGSIFTVSIPLEGRAAREELSGQEPLPDPRQDSKPILVVVEDNEDIRNYIRETLGEDYTVVLAKDGAEGWSAILKSVPDLVISDIMMPVMDGIELCSRIKKDVQVSHIPVVLLTAKDTNEARSEGYEAGADSYLTKPFTASMLRSRVRNLLESRQRLAEQFGSAIREREEQEVAANSFLAIDNEFVRRITELIEENLSSENLDVVWLSENLHMSVSTLYRKMKSLLGISANEYIRKIRMRKAAEMLASGNFNVSETAWNVGINSLIYFRQCFREEYGCSPSEYRRMKNPS
ncbi:MAG: response regulator [Bacteroidales bacterium]|nr:response regulator [Bacteroidales bacterium]